MRTVTADVLIVGSGGAGLYAAAKAAEAGVSVILVDKGLVGRSGATVSAAGLAATGPWSVQDDSEESHYQDTLRSGQLINNRELVRLLVGQAQARVREVEEWGLAFDHTEDGTYFLDHVAGHSHPRALARSDRAGLGLAKVLRRRALQLGVEWQEDTFVTAIVTSDAKAAGLTAIDSRSGEFLVLCGKAVVLATGGIGQLYPMTSNPLRAMGDGIALALRVRAETMDMEQVQFYPAGLSWPESLRGYGLGIVEHSRLFNRAGERFMNRYAPQHMEKSTRDALARAIYSEIEAGRGGTHRGVYLDATEVPAEVFLNFRHEHELCLERGIDLCTARAEVAPSAHYCMGGIRINARCETGVVGLFAAGEVTGGIMGANRLSGNSLADVTVFGAIAGREAANYARTSRLVRLDDSAVTREHERIRALCTRGRREGRPADLMNEIRRIMGDKAGVVRTEASLREALRDLMVLNNDLSSVGIEKRELRFNSELTAYLEAENMLMVSRAIVSSALARRESRGAHYVADYPHRDDEHWLVNVIATLEGSDIRTCVRPVSSGQTAGCPAREHKE